MCLVSVVLVQLARYLRVHEADSPGEGGVGRAGVRGSVSVNIHRKRSCAVCKKMKCKDTFSFCNASASTIYASVLFLELGFRGKAFLSIFVFRPSKNKGNTVTVVLKHP